MERTAEVFGGVLVTLSDDRFPVILKKDDRWEAGIKRGQIEKWFADLRVLISNMFLHVKEKAQRVLPNVFGVNFGRSDLFYGCFFFLST